jgi:hypothetical protein
LSGVYPSDWDYPDGKHIQPAAQREAFSLHLLPGPACHHRWQRVDVARWYSGTEPTSVATLHALRLSAYLATNTEPERNETMSQALLIDLIQEIDGFCRRSLADDWPTQREGEYIILIRRAELARVPLVGKFLLAELARHDEALGGLEAAARSAWGRQGNGFGLDRWGEIWPNLGWYLKIRIVEEVLRRASPIHRMAAEAYMKPSGSKKPRKKR